MRSKIHEHLKLRRKFSFIDSGGCDCNDYYIRHFTEGRNVLIEKDKCGHDGAKAIRRNRCKTLNMYRNGKEIVSTKVGQFTVAREFDDWLKELGLIDQELQVSQKG